MKATCLILLAAILTVTNAEEDWSQREDENDEDYIKRINHVYWPEEDAPNEETGMIYTVAQTLH